MDFVEMTWAGGEHRFRLTIDLLRALQDLCDAGPPVVLQRLSSQSWKVDDVIQPIRLGLEGGGLDKEEARKLVRRFVEERPLTESVLTARAVLLSALVGSADDQPGERQAEGESLTETPFRADNGGSPTSTNGAA